MLVGIKSTNSDKVSQFKNEEYNYNLYNYKAFLSFESDINYI